MSVKNESWRLDSFATPYYGHVIGSTPRALVLPRYQRSFVWNETKRQDLIDSLVREYPIGTLIVRRLGLTESVHEDSGRLVEAESFEILDGLQRATTLILHQLHPLGLVARDFVEHKLEVSNLSIGQLLGLVMAGSPNPSISKDRLLDVLVNWFRSCSVNSEFTNEKSDQTASFVVPTFDEDSFDNANLIDYLVTHCKISQPDILRSELGIPETSRCLAQFRNSVKRGLDISSISIPVLVWEGESEGAAAIFERVNQGGVKLNRYQVLAASWSSVFTDISQGEIVDESRKALMPPQGSVIIQKQGNVESNLDLYEALIGLSETLAKNYPHLFQPHKVVKRATKRSVLEKNKTHYYAFNIAALVLQVRLSDLEGISSMLESIPDSSRKGFRKIAEAILAAAAYAAKALSALTYAVPKEYSSAHGESSMTAMIAAIARHIYSGGSLDDLNYRTIRRHYLFDLVTPFTTSHANDQEAFDRVWIKKDENFVPNPHYLMELPDQELVNVLGEYWKTELARDITVNLNKRPRINGVQLTIMRLYAGPLASHQAVANYDLHIDHVIPYKRAQEWMKASGSVGGYAVGAVSNLAFIPGKINLSKGKETLEEWLGGSKRTALKTDLLKTYTVDQIWSLVPVGQGEIQAWMESTVTPVPSATEFNDLQTSIWSEMVRSLIA